MSQIFIEEPENLPLNFSYENENYVVTLNNETKELEIVKVSDTLPDLSGYQKTSEKTNDVSLINNFNYFNTKGVSDFLDSKKNVALGVAGVNSEGKIDISLIPDLALTKTVVAEENTFDDFLANVDKYTFEEGDSIEIIVQGGRPPVTEFYLFRGGDKSNRNNYAKIGVGEITISQVKDLQTILDGKVSLSSNETVSGLKTFSELASFNDIVTLKKYSDNPHTAVFNDSCGVFQNSDKMLQFFNVVDSVIGKNWAFDNSDLTKDLTTYKLPDSEKLLGEDYFTYGDWVDLSPYFNQSGTTATRVQGKVNQNGRVILDVVTIALPSEGFLFSNLPSEFIPNTSKYLTGLNRENNPVGVIVNTSGGVYTKGDLRNLSLEYDTK